MLLGDPAVAQINPKTDLGALSDDDQVSFIPMEAVTERTNTFTHSSRLLTEVRKGYTCFQNNDVLWAKITPCMQNGKSAEVHGLKNGVGFGSTEFHVIRAGAKAIPGFLWAILSMPRLLYAAQGAFTGSSGHQRVPASFLEQLEIPVPPLDVQRRLVAELDVARAERDRALAEAETLPTRLDNEISALLGMTLPSKNERKTYAIRLSASRGSRLDATYHHPRYIEALRALQSGKGMHLSLGDILLDIAGGATPKAKDQSLYADSGIKFLRILNVKSNRLDFSDLNHIQPEVHEGLLKRSQLAADDVLMTITGRVGTSAVVTEDDLPANINQHIVRLRIDTKRCLPRYLSAYLNTGLGTLLSNRPVSGGTRVALDYGAIRETPLLLPTLDVQRQVIAMVEASNAEGTRLRIHAETAWRNARERFEQQLLKGGKA